MGTWWWQDKLLSAMDAPECLWTNWAPGSSNFKYLQDGKLFVLDKVWHHRHILPECDIVVAKQFTSLAVDNWMNKHQNTLITFQIYLIPGTAECEGDGERDEDGCPGQQDLEKRRDRNWRWDVGGTKGLLSIRSEAGVRGREGEVQKSGLHCQPCSKAHS